MQARPIPSQWIDCVLGILETHDPSKIEWTLTAEINWQQFGIEQDAYGLLTKVLRAPEVLGHQVVGMRDRRWHLH